MTTQKSTFGVSKLYWARQAYRYFDATPYKEECQLEVYQQACDIMKENSFKSVIDVGCGSAFKLLKYLGDYKTIGLEVSPTLEWLVQTYPARRWVKSDFASETKMIGELVVCADVIEHLEYPDALLSFIRRMDFKRLVISTPARDLLYRPWNRHYWGPPLNPHHIREWTRREFRDYVGCHFDVLSHTITNRVQCTQMIVCRKYDHTEQNDR